MSSSPSSSSSSSSTTGPKNVVFLIATIQTGLSTIPSLIQSLLGILDQDPLLQVLIASHESHAVMTSSGTITNSCYELAMNAIAWFTFGLYRVYVDGPKQHPLIVIMAGFGKLVASGLLFKMYYNQEATILMVLVGCIPDSLLGMYFIYVWAQMGYTCKPVLNTEEQQEKKKMIKRI